MEQGSKENKKPFDWQYLYDNLLKPSDGHKQEDGTLAPKYELEEIRNKVAILATRAEVQKLRGDEDVDDKIRAGLTILKGGYPHKADELNDILEESSLKKL